MCFMIHQAQFATDADELPIASALHSFGDDAALPLVYKGAARGLNKIVMADGTEYRDSQLGNGPRGDSGQGSAQ